MFLLKKTIEKYIKSVSAALGVRKITNKIKLVITKVANTIPLLELRR